jgi:membrane protein YdbS with pleckstrin-like domain
MPVVPCPDCQRDVSTIAPACPHCGRPAPGGVPSAPVLPPLPAVEETLWKGTPAWTVLAGHVIGLALTLILLPVLTHAAAVRSVDLEGASRITRAGWLLTAILLLVQLVIFGVALLQLRSTLYTVTNQRVIIETGLIAKALSEIDLRYVDDSQFSQGVLHRMLGIGNVTLYSSDTTTPVYMLRSIRDPRGVRELIRAHAYKVSQRQLLTRAT